MWLDDLKTIIVAAGFASGSVYLSSKAVPPTGDGPYISLVESGGSGAERTQNTTGDGYQRPAAQVTARASTYPAARAALMVAYNALTVVQGQTINGVWYVEIRPLQTNPIDLNPDELGRARVAFNVIGFKRPS